MKKRTAVIKAKPYPVGGRKGLKARETDDDSVGQELARRVRTAGPTRWAIRRRRAFYKHRKHCQAGSL